MSSDRAVVNTLVSDHPAESVAADLLNFGEMASSLADFIANAETPLCLGIYGDWGSGKTSLLGMLEENVKNRHASILSTVRFNPWHYEHEESRALVFALLRGIESATRAELGGKSPAAGFAKVKKISVVTGIAVSDLVLRLATAGQVGVKDLTDIFSLCEEKLTREYDRWSDTVAEFSKTFAEVIEETLRETGKKGLVIFIDDLDRCLPDTVIDVLDSIKNYLCARGCIFVLAMDKRAVSQGMRAKYGEETTVSGEEYLRKIVQHSIEIPEIPVSMLNEYAARLLIALGFDASTEVEKPLVKVLEDANVLNPRMVKRIVNKFNAAARFGGNYQKRIPYVGGQHPALFVGVTLRECWPELYKQMHRHPRLLEILLRLAECTTHELRESKLVDDSPDAKYFQLARDYLADDTLMSFLRTREKEVKAHLSTRSVL